MQRALPMIFAWNVNSETHYYFSVMHQDSCDARALSPLCDIFYQFRRDIGTIYYKSHG
jgi:hypothetical protein